MKKRTALITGSLILLIFSLTWKHGMAAEVCFAKFGTTVPVEHPTFSAMTYFQTQASQLSDGALSIQLFPDSQLGSAAQLLAGLQFGSIEFAVLPSTLVASCDPHLLAISLPYLFRTDKHRHHVLDGPIGMRLLRSLETSNLIGLGFLDAGMAGLAMKETSIHSPQDLYGVSLGLISGHPDQKQYDALRQQSLQTLGAEVQFIQAEDAETALSSGEILGVETDLLTEDGRTPDSSNTRTLVLTDHRVLSDVIVASKQWFETLSPEVQRALRAASRLTVLRQRDLWTAAMKETTARLQAKNVSVSAPEQADFSEAVQPVYRWMYETQGEEFKELIQAIRAVR